MNLDIVVIITYRSKANKNKSPEEIANQTSHTIGFVGAFGGAIFITFLSALLAYKFITVETRLIVFLSSLAILLLGIYISLRRHYTVHRILTIVEGHKKNVSIVYARLIAALFLIIFILFFVFTLMATIDISLPGGFD